MTHDLAKAARALLDTITPGLSTRGIPVALVHNLNAALLAHSSAQAQGEAQAVACRVCGGGKYLISAALEPNRNRFHQKGCPGDTHPTPAPSPSEVELAREKCVLACRRAAEEYERNGGVLYNDRHQTICANAVSVGRALLAAEAAAKKETR